MSDAKPFAVYDEFSGMVSVAGVAQRITSLETFDMAAALNAAVARERREAAAEALEEAARDADCYAEDTMEHLGHQEGLLADAIRLRVVRWLRTRAAALRKGDV